MSRSDYSDSLYPLEIGRWAGQVASSIRGKRGQKFLKELLEALDAMPSKRLITDHLRKDGEVCALGAIGERRGLNLEIFDPQDAESLADAFDVTPQLIREIEFINDECHPVCLPGERWYKIREWVESKIDSKPII